MFILFLESILIGLAVSAPIGPVGVMCIKSTISHRIFAGLAVGIGSAIATTFFAVLIGLGLASMTDFLISIHSILKFGGAAFLLYLGISYIFKKTDYVVRGQSASKKTLGKTFTASFFITIISPMTILTFLGIMSALEIEAKNRIDVIALTLGVLVGCILWWIVLVTAIHFTAKRLSEKVLSYINWVSGIIIIGFAVYILGWT